MTVAGSGSGSGTGSDDVADNCGQESCARNNNERECCAPYRATATPTSDQLADELTKALVAPELARVKPFVKACGSKVPTAHGAVKVHLEVARDGVVSDASVKLTPDATLGSCAAGVLRLAKFPATQTGGAFTSSFDF
jgi:pyruvate dehydrogenase complex dehydrogenase (E1) component